MQWLKGMEKEVNIYPSSHQNHLTCEGPGKHRITFWTANLSEILLRRLFQARPLVPLGPKQGANGKTEGASLLQPIDRKSGNPWASMEVSGPKKPKLVVLHGLFRNMKSRNLSSQPPTLRQCLFQSPRTFRSFRKSWHFLWMWVVLLGGYTC